MRDGLLIRWRGVGEALEWLRIEGGRAGIVHRETAPAATVVAKAARIVVLLPAESVLMVGLALPARKRDAALKAAAFAIEEQVAAPIESVQVVIGAQAVDGVWASAVIARAQLAAVVADLQTRGIRADALHADAACLAIGTVIGIDDQRVLARLDRDRALACDAGLWPELARRADVPDAVTEVDEPLTTFAEHLRELQPLNLLAGEFASVHRGADALRWWRVAAVLGGVCVLAFTLWMQLDVWRLQSRLDQLNQAMTQVYRERFPDAVRVPQPRVMIEQALRQAGASGSVNDSALNVLARAAAVIASHTQVQLDGIEYRGGKLELRLLAPDIAALDALREGLASSLAKPVTLDSANAREGRVDGRLSIGGAP